MILARVLDALGLGNERANDRSHSEQRIPVRVVTGQTTGFIGDNEPHPPQ